MSVCVSAGDCARKLILAMEQKLEAGPATRLNGQRVGVPIQVPMDL